MVGDAGQVALALAVGLSYGRTDLRGSGQCGPAPGRPQAGPSPCLRGVLRASPPPRPVSTAFATGSCSAWPASPCSLWLAGPDRASCLLVRLGGGRRRLSSRS
jgi:hypothetical protein